MPSAQVPERVSTKSFVVLMIENSKSNHLGAQGTFNAKSAERANGSVAACGLNHETLEARNAPLVEFLQGK